MPKVSVIIPVHNAEQYLEQSVGSLVNQTLKDIEIICVDDASIDNSYEKLKVYEMKDSRVKVYHHDIAQSALGARKTGVMAAAGEYIMFLDADDYYAADACETAYNAITEKSVDILHFTADVEKCGNVSDEKIKAVKDFMKPYSGELKNNQVFEYCFDKKAYNHTLINKIYKADICKKAYEQTEDTYMIFAEDLYVYFIISDTAKSYCGIDTKPLYFYCYGRGVTQLDNCYTIDKFEKNCQHAKVIKALRKYCSDNDKELQIYNKIIKSLHDEWIIRSIRIYENFMNSDDKKQGKEILNRYWGHDDVEFMTDKYNYVQSRKSIVTTFKYLMKSITVKGFGYTVKIARY